MTDVESTRQAQRELYGEPLGDIIDRCRAALGISQAKVATILGMSAPMLSQVANGHRIKIGNPAAVQRLRLMIELSDEVSAGQLDASDAIERIQSAQPAEVLTGTTQRSMSSSEIAERVQAAFRRVASAPDYLQAADRIAEEFPDVADLLRALGAGRTDDAVAALGSQRGG